MPDQHDFNQDSNQKTLGEETLNKILANLQVGLIVTDCKMKVILLNTKACELASIQPEQAYGKHLSTLLPNQEILEIASENQPLSTEESEITFDNGSTCQVHVTSLTDVGLLITLNDITRQKELDRIKSDFVNSVSHDLRTPLTAILSYVELIERAGPISDLQKEFVHRIQGSAQSITAIINDLLDLGRIEAGFDTRKEPVDFAAIIRYVVDGQQPRLDEMSIKLDLQSDTVLPDVLGNAIQLRQMLNNLIYNAIKCSPAGGVITIYTQLREGQIITQVSDTGIGIPYEDQPYVFDKFYRASNSPPDHPGSGLGLAIVKSIVENHNGRIWVDSIPGKGATFTVVLPTSDYKQP